MAPSRPKHGDTYRSKDTIISCSLMDLDFSWSWMTMDVSHGCLHCHSCEKPASSCLCHAVDSVLAWQQEPANTTFFLSHNPSALTETPSHCWVNPSAPIETPSHCWVEVIIVERTLFLSWGRGFSFFSINIIFI